jgi:hypothetical protein
MVGNLEDRHSQGWIFLQELLEKVHQLCLTKKRTRGRKLQTLKECTMATGERSLLECHRVEEDSKGPGLSLESVIASSSYFRRSKCGGPIELSKISAILGGNEGC